MLEICIERNPKCTAWSLAFFLPVNQWMHVKIGIGSIGSIEDIVERCRKYWKVRMEIAHDCTI